MLIVEISFDQMKNRRKTLFKVLFILIIFNTENHAFKLIYFLNFVIDYTKYLLELIYLMKLIFICLLNCVVILCYALYFIII